MASRVAEVIYRLKDLFSGPAKKVEGSYDRIKRSSRQAADSVERDNNRIGKSFGAVVAGLKRLAGPLAALAAIRGLARGVGSTAEQLDKLGKAADQLQIDVGSLDALQFAAERSGVAVDKVAASLFTLQKRTGEAALGIGAAKVAFEQLGIDAQAFTELNVEEQITELATAISSLESEEQQAALSSALFGKGNAQDFLKLLQQGGDGIADLVRQGKELRTVTEEQTKIAARFEDAWTNAGRGIKGAFEGFFVTFQRGFVRAAESIGVLEREVVPLEDQLRDARIELERLEAVGSRSNAGNKALQEQRKAVERLTQALKDQKAEIEANARETERRAQALRNAEAAEEEYRSQVERLTLAFQNQTSSRRRDLDRETAELRAARAEQASIEEEFANLREEVTATQTEDVSGLDVQTKALEARRALAEGDADAAIKAARQGADLLRDLKAEGDEAGFVLGFLADELGRIAKEAAAQQTDKEVIDVAKAAESFNTVTAKLNALQSDAAQAGTEIGKAVVNAISAELQAANFGNAVRAGLSSYTDSLQNQLEQQGPK